MYFTELPSNGEPFTDQIREASDLQNVQDAGIFCTDGLVNYYDARKVPTEGGSQRITLPSSDDDPIKFRRRDRNPGLPRRIHDVRAELRSITAPARVQDEPQDETEAEVEEQDAVVKVEADKVDATTPSVPPSKPTFATSQSIQSQSTTTGLPCATPSIPTSSRTLRDRTAKQMQPYSTDRALVKATFGSDLDLSDEDREGVLRKLHRKMHGPDAVMPVLDTSSDLFRDEDEQPPRRRAWRDRDVIEVGEDDGWDEIETDLDSDDLDLLDEHAGTRSRGGQGIQSDDSFLSEIDEEHDDVNNQELSASKRVPKESGLEVILISSEGHTPTWAPLAEKQKSSKAIRISQFTAKPRLKQSFQAYTDLATHSTDLVRGTLSIPKPLRQTTLADFVSSSKPPRQSTLASFVGFPSQPCRGNDLLDEFEVGDDDINDFFDTTNPRSAPAAAKKTEKGGKKKTQKASAVDDDLDLCPGYDYAEPDDEEIDLNRIVEIDKYDDLDLYQRHEDHDPDHNSDCDSDCDEADVDAITEIDEYLRTSNPTEAFEDRDAARWIQTSDPVRHEVGSLSNGEREKDAINTGAVASHPALVPMRSRDTSKITCSIFQKMCLVTFHFFDEDQKKADASGKEPRMNTREAAELLDFFGPNTVWSWVNNMINDNPNLSKVLDEGSWADLEALTAIGGDITSTKLRWYMNIVTDKSNAYYLKLYAGQALVMFKRADPHIRNLVGTSVDESLHYWIATQPGRQCGFVTFGVDDTLVTALCRTYPDRPFLLGLQNLIEQYICLVFQTLPKPILKIWLPKDIFIRPDIGLNVVPPMGRRRQGRVRELLMHSVDPEVRSYIDVVEKRQNKIFDQMAEGLESLIQDPTRAPGVTYVYKPQTPKTITLRDGQTYNASYFLDKEPSREELEDIEVRYQARGKSLPKTLTRSKDDRKAIKNAASKSLRDQDRANPDDPAAILRKEQRKQARERPRARNNKKARAQERRVKIKADPVSDAKERERSRIASAKHRDEIRADPVRLEQYRKREAAKKSRNYSKMMADPIRHAKKLARQQRYKQRKKADPIAWAATRKQYYETMQADPVRRARRLENNRRSARRRKLNANIKEKEDVAVDEWEDVDNDVDASESEREDANMDELEDDGPGSEIGENMEGS